MIFKSLQALAVTLALGSVISASPLTLLRRALVLDSVSPSQQEIILAQKPTGAFVTYTIDEAKQNLIINYGDVPGYTYKEVHLYIGTSPPTTSAPGQFPYTSNNGACTIATDAQTASCTVPLSNLGNDLCADPKTTFYIASHASHVSDVAPSTQETSWGNGPLCIGKVQNNGQCAPWALYSTFQFVCTSPPGPVVNKKLCPRGTAFGYPLASNATDFTTGLLNTLSNANRWGWYFTASASSLAAGASVSGELHVGAGNNDRSKGFVAGSFLVQGSSTGVTVEYQLTATSSYDLAETHVYASCTKPTNTAPGQYGNQHVLAGFDPIQQNDVYTFSASQLGSCWAAGGRIYFILHASVGEVVDESAVCGQDFGDT